MSLQRSRRGKKPAEPWTLKTRNAYTRAYEKTERLAAKFGTLEDHCLRVPSLRRIQVGVHVSNTLTRRNGKLVCVRQVDLFRHMPYQLAYLRQHETNPGTGNEISHVCGYTKCINYRHMRSESHRDNVSRWKCHRAIRRWIKEQRKNGHFVRSGKHTFKTCSLHRDGCMHRTSEECFIMVGDIKDDGSRRSHKRHHLSRPKETRLHLDVFEGTPWKRQKGFHRRSQRISQRPQVESYARLFLGERQKRKPVRQRKKGKNVAFSKVRKPKVKRVRVQRRQKCRKQNESRRIRRSPGPLRINFDL